MTTQFAVCIACALRDIESSTMPKCSSIIVNGQFRCCDNCEQTGEPCFQMSPDVEESYKVLLESEYYGTDEEYAAACSIFRKICSVVQPQVDGADGLSPLKQDHEPETDGKDEDWVDVQEDQPEVTITITDCDNGDDEEEYLVIISIN